MDEMNFEKMLAQELGRPMLELSVKDKLNILCFHIGDKLVLQHATFVVTVIDRRAGKLQFEKAEPPTS